MFGTNKFSGVLQRVFRLFLGDNREGPLGRESKIEFEIPKRFSWMGASSGLLEGNGSKTFFSAVGGGYPQ